jgi:GTP-binding protein
MIMTRKINPPAPPAGEEGRLLRQIFSASCDFIWGTAKSKDWPKEDLPEIAFVGRSNVGKSSLLNALTNRKDLARVSRTPGRTQQINFFNLGRFFCLVDMPGYGYAKVGRQLEEKWRVLADEYFKQRSVLKRVYVLVDSRHGIQDHDLMLLQWFDRLVVPYRIIMTKSDKLDKKDVASTLEQMALTLQKHPSALAEPFLISAEKKVGIDELRQDIADLLAQ